LDSIFCKHIIQKKSEDPVGRFEPLSPPPLGMPVVFNQNDYTLVTGDDGV